MNTTNIPVLLTLDAWSLIAKKLADQHWFASALYVVATPIGNLSDLGLRAWQVLMRVNVIAAEDTRISRSLLNAWGINTPLIAAHSHNEMQAALSVCDHLALGDTVALVSDAGTPTVSDPGARIVRAVRAAGFRVVPIPGASALITALMASGVTTDANPAFVFAGFAPSKSAARMRWLTEWASMPMPVVIFESPQRVAATLADMRSVCGARCEVTIARELTKRFEEIVTFTLAEVGAWLDADTYHSQGEFVLILHSSRPKVDGDISEDVLKCLSALIETMSLRDAVRMVSKVARVPRNILYEHALALKAPRMPT